MRNGRRLILALLPAAALLVVACSPMGRYRALGVSHDATGQVRIHYGACEGEHVRRVQLYRFHGEVVGDSDDHLLWEVVGNAFRRVDVFTVGRAPAGFDETVTLRAGIPFQRRLGVKVYSDQTRGEMQSFTLASIPQGVVYARGEQLDEAGFRDMAERLCAPVSSY